MSASVGGGDVSGSPATVGTSAGLVMPGSDGSDSGSVVPGAEGSSGSDGGASFSSTGTSQMAMAVMTATSAISIRVPGFRRLDLPA
jgi:hypothetical protein